MIERKADDCAKDDGVLRKKDAAERWSRAVRDDGDTESVGTFWHRGRYQAARRILDRPTSDDQV